MLKDVGSLADLGDMAKMIQQAQDMQARLAEMQEKLDRVIVIGSSGGGLVTARVTAKGEVTGLDIDPSLLVASEKEAVEDLIVAAIRDAQAKGAARNKADMARLGESLGIPPGIKLPF